MREKHSDEFQLYGRSGDPTVNTRWRAEQWFNINEEGDKKYEKCGMIGEQNGSCVSLSTQGVSSDPGLWLNSSTGEPA